jgi:hypothetical protein
VLTSRVITLFHSLPVAIAPEDVRGVGLHITKLRHSASATREEQPRRVFFPQQLSGTNMNGGREIIRTPAPILHNSSTSNPLPHRRDGYTIAIPSMSQIDRDVLTQLPDDLKQEIKSNLRHRSLQREGGGAKKRRALEPNDAHQSKRRPSVLGRCQSFGRAGDGSLGRVATSGKAKELARSPFSLTQQVCSPHFAGHILSSLVRSLD